MAEQVIEAPVEEAVSERPWRAVLAPEGVVSGDGRKFSPGSLTWRDLPLPLSWQKQSAMGHDGSVVVGHIDTITRNGDLVEATGFLNNTPEAAEVIPLLENRSVKGVSVDVDMMTATFETPDGTPLDLAGDVGIDTEVVMVASKGRIAGATICPIPAFMQATLELGAADGADNAEFAFPDKAEKVVAEDTQESLDAEAKVLLAGDLEGEDLIKAADALLERYTKIEATPPDALVKAAGLTDEIVEAHLDASGFVLDFNTEAVESFETVSEENWEGGAENFTPEQWQRSTLIHLAPGPGQDPDTKGLHKLPVRNPGGTLVRRAILSAASILAGARGGVKAPSDQKVTAAQEVVRLYREELGEDPPKSVIRLSGSPEKNPDPVGETGETALVPVLTASAVVVQPDAFWDPMLDGPTALTVDGRRVFGHLAQWGTCHIGFEGQCVTPPKSAAGYAYFMTGEVETPDGVVLPVGTLTMGTGHAAAQLGHRPALSHYDNTGTAIADVCMGEDDHGIWFSGLLRPGVSDDAVAALRASGGLSGDWRRIGGTLELVAALVVNVPGFPVPRLTTASERGRQTALVASGVVVPHVTDSRELDPEEWGRRISVFVAQEMRALSTRQQKAQRLAARIGRDRKSRALAAAAALNREV